MFTNKIKYLLVSAIFAMFATASVAQVSVGISGTGFSADATGSETQDTSQSRDETLEAAYGSVFIEYDFGGFSVGIDAIPYTIDSETATNDQSNAKVDSGTNTVQVDIENVVTLYGIVPLSDTGAYLKAGIIQGDLITNEAMGATSTSYPDADLDGETVMIGYAYDTGAGATVRLEAGLTDYDDVSVTGTGGDGTANTVTLSGLDGTTVRLSIVKAF